MNSEDIVLTKVLADPKNWEYILDNGVKSSTFEQKRNVFTFIQSYYAQYGELPKEDVVKKYHPKWEEVPHENSIEFWVKQLHDDKKLRIQNTYIEEWFRKKKEEGTPEELSAILLKLNTELLEETNSTRDIDMNNHELELREYEERKSKEGVVGIPFGLPEFDNQTGGAKGGDLGVIMGPPKNMKTWLELFCAYQAWTKSNASILLISKEMSEKQMRVRTRWFDLQEIPYQLFRTAQLGRTEKKYKEVLGEIGEKRKPFIISADDGDMDSGGGVSLVSSKIDRYNPDIVFIDGAYLLSDDRSGGDDWKAIRNVFRDLKKLARRKNVPILVTTQPQRLKEKDGSPLRRKLTLEDVGGSYSIAQDCDYMFGVRRMSRDVIEIYIIGIREGDVKSWQMRLDLDNGIIGEVESEISEEEMVTEFEEIREEINERLLF